ncbi:hypothetical protein PRUPE_8G109100 [Prunus persica]|uniref:Uncharacterized protein n=1 Tax=Prunus persica TaxID=3760 RepID=A0A251MWA7_PRUPE|nr:hypothetical protein PRUPE_8G109100 [Prunus persica]
MPFCQGLPQQQETTQSCSHKPKSANQRKVQISTTLENRKTTKRKFSQIKPKIQTRQWRKTEASPNVWK